MNRKALFGGVLFPLMMGSVALTQALGRPSMANTRSVDIMSIFAAGMCFGVALVALIAVLRHKI